MNLKIFTDNVEPEALNQIYTLAKHPSFADAKIRIMPDTHAGTGCVIGFTANLGDKIVPNLVGVDIGCLDADTEFVTPNGFKKISEYKKGDKVLQYDPATDQASFAEPITYIDKPCEKFYHFKNSKGLDQMVSEEHRMLVYTGYKGRGYAFCDLLPEELSLKALQKGYYSFKASFKINNKGVNLSDAQLRFRVALCADGQIRICPSGLKTINFHFSKKRKINRLRTILNDLNYVFSENKYSDGTTGFYIGGKENDLTNVEKTFNDLYLANYEQLKIITEECLLWDGHKGYRSYFSSTNKEFADFIQFAFSATNQRSGLGVVKSEEKNRNNVYTVTPTKNEYVAYCKPSIIEKPNMRKYCFVVPSSYFVTRRNGKIAITGNCGMLTVKISDTDIDLQKLDDLIRKEVPSGHNFHEKEITSFDYKQLRCADLIKNKQIINPSIGTLGGGNHFIEVDRAADSLYLVIHTGSRNLGKQVAEIYQSKAIDNFYGKANLQQLVNEKITELKAAHREKDIENEVAALKAAFRPEAKVPKDLAYLTGDQAADYLHDMRLCQKYAELNRSVIADIITGKAKLHELERFETIHNYIGDDNIIRKGAIAAYAGQKVLIPLNMRDGCIIGIGKGNEDWNNSAPHGAGRLMSRSKAKENLNVEDFKKTMEGIFTTSANASTIDEAPFAYKPSEEIIEAVKDTIDIVEIIKPIYNFKDSIPTKLLEKEEDFER